MARVEVWQVKVDNKLVALEVHFDDTVILTADEADTYAWPDTGPYKAKITGHDQYGNPIREQPVKEIAWSSDQLKAGRWIGEP